MKNTRTISSDQTLKLPCLPEDGWILLNNIDINDSGDKEEEEKEEKSSIKNTKPSMKIDVGPKEKQKLTKTIKTNTNNLPLNKNNRCFANSVLVALFLQPNIYITSVFISAIIPKVLSRTKMLFSKDSVKQDLKYRQQVQKHLIEFIRNLRSFEGNKAADCEKLLEVFSNANFQSNFADCQQHDACDFFNILCENFHLSDDVNSLKMQVFGTNDLVNTPPKTNVMTTDVTNSTGLIHYIVDFENDSTVQQNMNQINDDLLSSPYSSHNFFRVITKTSFFSNYFFCVNVERTTKGSAVNRKNILVNKTITLENGRKFKLFSAVLHNGSSINSGHYTTLINSENGDLMIFDDLKQSVVPSMLRMQDIASQIVMIFYVAI
jgi:hypothetical protein